jgi:hypothetical protein
MSTPSAVTGLSDPDDANKEHAKTSVFAAQDSFSVDLQPSPTMVTIYAPNEAVLRDLEWLKVA